MKSTHKKIITVIMICTVAVIGYFAGFDKGKASVTTTSSDAEAAAPDSDDQILTIDHVDHFVPEGYRRLNDYTILIDIAVMPNTLTAVWVEYGLEARDLSLKTPPMSNELGMGTAGEYGSYSIPISHSELEPGRSYFYRVVGEKEGGGTIASGLNRFTAGK